MEKQRWEVVPGVCGTPGAEGIATYGVRVIYDGGTWQWSDVDTDPKVVRRLIQRLNRAQPEPCHFAEIVLDFIEETAANPSAKKSCFCE